MYKIVKRKDVAFEKFNVKKRDPWWHTKIKGRRVGSCLELGGGAIAMFRKMLNFCAVLGHCQRSTLRPLHSNSALL